MLYKLDRGVEHILVDEAQDTSRAQWNILAKLAEDFLSGAGAGPASRTLLRRRRREAVDLLVPGRRAASVRRACGACSRRRHRKAERAFADVRLTYSFRSAPVVLDAVDKVFARPRSGRASASARPTAEPHSPIRDSLPGRRRTLAAARSEPAPEPGDWAAPLDAQKRTHPANALADRIAGVIAQWIAPGSPERVVDHDNGAAAPGSRRATS